MNRGGTKYSATQYSPPGFSVASGGVSRLLTMVSGLEAEIRGELEGAVEALRGSLPQIEAMLLYGSVARGEARMDSDVDLVLVVEGSVDRSALRDVLVHCPRVSPLLHSWDSLADAQRAVADEPVAVGSVIVRLDALDAGGRHRIQVDRHFETGRRGANLLREKDNASRPGRDNQIGAR